MAERPSELNETPDLRTANTDAALNTADAFDSDDTENRSIDSYRSNEDFDTTADAASDETSDETEKIRTNIEETRSQMSETIDAIQERLSFSNISEQVKDEVSEHITSAIQTAKDSVYGATLGKVGNVMNYVNKGMNEMADTNVARTARRNPLAVGLIGLGLGLLYMNSGEKRSQYRYNRNQNNFDYDYDYDREDDYSRREFSSKDNRSTLTTAQNKVGETVSSVAGTVSETVSGAAGTVGDVAGKAYKQVGSVAETAQDQYEYYMDENPLAVGAVALALGAAVGMSIPSTRFEGELMGETRDNLMQKAGETARETIEKVKNVAGEVTEKVKSAAGEVTQTVRDEAQNQGLT